MRKFIHKATTTAPERQDNTHPEPRISDHTRRAIDRSSVHRKIDVGLLLSVGDREYSKANAGIDLRGSRDLSPPAANNRPVTVFTAEARFGADTALGHGHVARSGPSLGRLGEAAARFMRPSHLLHDLIRRVRH